MNEHLHLAAADVLAYLMTTTNEVQPHEAQERLRAVQARHPETVMELVWELESYDHSFHYDVLVRPGTGPTLSMSVCRDQSLPWPLRGVRRWTDANLVQVNGRMLTMEDAVAFLDVLWNEAPILERIVEACLIREELEKRPIEVSDEELQTGMDGLRRTHKLYTADDTHRWMQQRGMNHEQLERLVVGNLTCAKLRTRVAEERTASYFEAHRDELDIAYIARIECADEATARGLHHRIASGAIDFFEGAQQQFLASTNHECFTFETLRRRDSREDLGAAIFAGACGDVVGPFRVGRSHVVARLLSMRPARRDEATNAVIEQILFDQWIAERRRSASVTWHWGQVRDAA